ncbi:TPA: hypothetical protein ACPZOD_001962 [Yersinia enterocolitica]|nr:hypothetical protein [Yersinia enterocolitica]
MSNTTAPIDPSTITALMMALPILASSLDDKTQAKIRAEVEEREFQILTAMGEHPAAEMMKQNLKLVRTLLAVYGK